MPDKTLRLILGDQLNYGHSWFEEPDDDVIFVMMEIKPESEYVTHHIQKITGIFAAMREFARWLESDGHRVRYFRITDDDNAHDFQSNIEKCIEQYDAGCFEYMEPDEWRLDEQLRQMVEHLEVKSAMCSTEHFYTERGELKEFFQGRKSLVMESFYRAMRKKHDVLMDDGEPATGTWNYDKENRKKLPADHKPPDPLVFDRDVTDIVDDIKSAELQSIGTIEPQHFMWPITRKEALSLLDFFIETMLFNFGTYQDALTPDFWSVYHSRLSFALNTKMLDPREVVNAVEDAWRTGEHEVTIAQVEGFIRQILGWREFMRGIYWMKMPEYRELNYFNADEKLPDYFWTGETKMRCVGHAVGQSLEYAYAHHIQRLMVTGNFCALAGIDPDAVDNWYLGIYIDAFEWVEITNTRGMSQFADGGIVGTKPYVSSASYINKMSHYCKDCYYDHNARHGEKACPFNSFYWHFLARNEDQLGNNPRMGMVYRVWQRFDDKEQKAIIDQAEHYLDKLEEL